MEKKKTSKKVRKTPIKKKTATSKKETKTAVKTVVKKSEPKKVTAKKATAKKATAKKVTAKKVTAQKVTAKEISVQAPKALVEALVEKVESRVQNAPKKTVSEHKADRWICTNCHTNNNVHFNPTCKRCGNEMHAVGSNS